MLLIDDFYFAGSESLQTRLINKLHYVFAVKSEVAEFQYIGLDIKRMVRIFNSKQNKYVKKLKYILVEEGGNLKDTISTTEITETKQIIG